MAPAAVDFRTIAFDLTAVDRSGRDIGMKIYPRLYAVENLVRVLVHSVLVAQVNPTWWAVAASPDLQKSAARAKQRYQSKPWHSAPGAHDIYYIDLSELNTIITDNSNLFLPIVADIDQWVARIEQIRVPRNVVAHMNWPSSTDRQRIEVFHADIKALLQQVSTRVQLLIP